MSSATQEAIDAYTKMPSSTQQRVISSLQIPPSVLSLIGSSLIIYSIRKCRKRTPHRRIMFALSACNIISTIGLMLDPFLVPRDASPGPWVFAVGNDASCVMLGAISQFSIISQPMYLGFLSIFFLFAVKFGISQRDFEAKYERWMHGVILVLAISTSLGGILLGFFRPNVVSPGCWINPPVSEGCEDGCRERWFAIIFGAVPSVASLLAIVISNAMLYVHVRKTVVKGQQKTMSRETKLTEFASSIMFAFQADDADQTGSETQQKDGSDVQCALSNKRYAMSKRSSSFSDMSVLSEAKGTVLRSSDKQWKRVRKVGQQAFLYVGAFLVTFSWSFAIHYLNSSDYEYRNGSGEVLFPWLVLQAIFLPALGFLNATIFILPKYKSTRKKYDCEPCWWVLQQVLSGEAEKAERFSSNLSIASSKAASRSDVMSRQDAPLSIARIPSAVNLHSSASLSIDNMIEEEEEVLDPTEPDFSLELTERKETPTVAKR